ncbi:uncharacterized protein LOC114473664 [Gouania willdenowi]|uniref:uncharacterized protein LOC114473664 n=1 Tax=Gouania willdenowi TaxID=441366 RepID=UPI0010554557|nr:uncharacterized protein LOC114473664 [Gouania willdenowi]
MKKVPVRTMMAWIWLGLVAVVRLSMAEEPRRDAAETLADLEALWSDSEPPKEPRSGEEFLPVPVWRFVEVPDAADSLDLGRPQFGCSDTSLSVRLSLIRHSGLRLQDGRRWLSVEEGCRGSVQSLGSWLLLKIPYTSCHVELLTVNGTHYHQLKVRYLDHLLQANVTAVASCEDPATSSLYPAAPLVRCRATDVTVKLPLGNSLKRVRALGKGDVVGSMLTTSTPDAVLVQISTTADKDSFLEIIYLDSAGEMFSMLAACLKAGEDIERTRQRRDILKQHIKDLWEYGHHPAHQYELNYQQDFLYPGAHCKGPKCKYMTPSPLPDCDDVTPSPLPDCDDVTPSPLPDCDDVTPSPLPDCDDVTPSPLPDCDDVTPSPLPDCDDVTPSPLPDCDDVTPSPLPDCDKPTNVTICVSISVITRLVKVEGSFTSLWINT